MSQIFNFGKGTGGREGKKEMESIWKRKERKGGGRREARRGENRRG